MKPNVSHFRVFGYIAYEHVLHENRSKLDPKLISVSSLDILWNIRDIDVLTFPFKNYK
jgi:hypothetical protein